MSTVDAFAEDPVCCEQVTQVEDILCQFLEWRLAVPTPSEILKNLLFFANNEYDFSDVLQKCTDNVLICSIAYGERLFRYSSMALASLIVAL
jgi:hypothetical protein